MAQDGNFPYYKPGRAEAMRETRRFVAAGYPQQQIQQQLRLPGRTFYPYLEAVFEHDRERISNYVTSDELLNQAAILQERMNEMYRTMHEMANDKTIDPSARTPKGSAIAIIKAFLPTARSFAIGYSRPTTNKSSST